MKTNRILIEILALITIMPVIRANTHPLIYLFVFLLWLINSCQLTSAEFVFKDSWGVAKWWIILIVYEIILSVIGFSSTAPNNFLIRIPVYLVPVMMTFVLRKYSNKEKKHLFIFITMIIVFTIIQNTLMYIQDPSFFAGFSLKVDIYKWTNWGTSGFVACTLFMFPSCYLLCKTKLSGTIRFLSLLGLFLPLFYISFVNERATSFLLLLFTIVMLVYVRKVRIKNDSWFTIFTLVLFVGGFALVAPLLNWLSTVLNSEKLITRFGDITNSIQNMDIDEDAEGSLSARFLLMTVDIETWTKSYFNFFFGIGEDALDDSSKGFVSDLVELGIGQHSQILDFLAMYGIVGTSMLLKAFYSTFSFIKSLVDDKTMVREIIIVFISYILMNILNNTLYVDVLIVMFVLFAIAVSFYSQNSMLTNRSKSQSLN